jgi:hypothetical protein
MYIEEQMQFHKAFSLNPVRNIVNFFLEKRHQPQPHWLGVAVAATIYEKKSWGTFITGTDFLPHYPEGCWKTSSTSYLHQGRPRTERFGYSKVIIVLQVILVSVEENRINMLDKVYFSNVWFHVHRYINSQKCRIWSRENPHALYWCIVCTVLQACSWSHLHQDHVELKV